jgi:hypothetical protein
MRSRPDKPLSLAAEMAAALDATLTLVHITGSVEVCGPGGSHVDHAWKEMIVGFAAKEIARLQQDVGTTAEAIIDSGDVRQQRADVSTPVRRCLPSGRRSGETPAAHARPSICTFTICGTRARHACSRPAGRCTTFSTCSGTRASSRPARS